MGCCAGKDDDGPKVFDSVSTPAFTLIPAVVPKERSAFSMMERVNWRSFFLGKDEFEVSVCTQPGSYEEALFVKQAKWDMGQDRMELGDKKTGKTSAVVRRSRNPLTGDCFYIYTVEEPYPGAQRNKWNEELDGQRLYCFGFLQKGWGNNFTVSTYHVDPENGANEDGKDPYKAVYRLQAPGWFNPNIAVYQLGEDGNIADDKRVVAMASRDRWQWESANQYAIEVAPGADAALMVICMAMIDEIKEDAAERNK
jgi:hypothetical protein